MNGVIGVGNAITDMLAILPNDNILSELDFPKGSMQLVDSTTISTIQSKVGQYIQSVKSGGSAGNTMYGIASMGIPAAYIGKIGNDAIGELYFNDMKNQGVQCFFSHSDINSGLAVAMITPDSERTFATFLGAASELSPSEINNEWFSDYQIIHIEGYLVFNPDLLIRLGEIAIKHKLKVSFDMSSYNIVETNRTFITDFVKKYADIVFANEEEAYAFCGKKPEEAIHELANYCEIAVIKLGKKGSLMKHQGKVYTISAIDSKAIDTTGAGDWYASGFLYGLSMGYDMERCGKIASLLAGKVVEHIGAKIPADILHNVVKMAKNL